MFISKIKLRLGFTLIGLGTYLVGLTADSTNQWIMIGVAIVLIILGAALIDES